jgi:predicted ester cyclase
MDPEKNKKIVEEFFQGLNGKNPHVLAEFFVPGSLLAGGFVSQMMVMKMAFPDNSFTVNQIVADENLVMISGTIRGTHTGPLAGLPAFGRLEPPIPPTGKAVLAEVMFSFSLKDGKIVSLSSVFDQTALLQQTGWKITPPG